MADLASLRANAEEYCTTRDAAGVLGVSLRTVQVWVESGALRAWKTPGGHRRITVKSLEKLAAERIGALAAAPAAPEAPAADPYRLLVVDDDPGMLRLYELEIASWDLPVQLSTASNGMDALIKVGKLRPHLLITDLTMPEIDGFGMIRRLRSNEDCAGMPLIVVSGLDEAALKAGGLPADIPLFPKPVPFDALQAAVKRGLAAFAGLEEGSSTEAA
jgi:excisionase family DNA binding protein